MKKLINMHVSHSFNAFPTYESLLVQEIENFDPFLKPTPPPISPIFGRM
jgi:hypothetical protein